jgi:hypothetical protein
MIRIYCMKKIDFQLKKSYFKNWKK